MTMLFMVSLLVPYKATSKVTTGISGDITTHALGIYGSKYYGNFRIDGGASYAFISSDTNRATLLGTAQTTFDAKAASL